MMDAIRGAIQRSLQFGRWEDRFPHGRRSIR
jgi:hypothetical protein